MVVTRRSCPICCHRHADWLHTQTFEAVEGLSLLSGYDVVSCESCGCVFADGIPDDSVFASYYGERSKYEHAYRGGTEHAEETERLRLLADWIAAQIPSDASLIDMGCGTGRLLAWLRERGFASAAGLDPSSTCVQNARILSQCPVIHSAIRDKPPEYPPADAVVLSAVLEHVPDVNATIQMVSTWLRDDGALFLEVPDAGHFASVQNAPYQEFSVEHINFFSGAALENLMHVHGFDVVAIDRTTAPVGPGCIGHVVRSHAIKSGNKTEARRENESRSGIVAYIATCADLATHEETVLQRIADAREPIYIWGVGTLCQRLLSTGKLAKVNIRGFVDSSSHHEGKTVAGKPILPPRQLPDDGMPILITSWQFEDEIRRQISDLRQSPRTLHSLRR
jgi:SAM-dependent methyltransferase